MKKVLVLLTALAAIALCGCGGGESNSTNTATSTTSSNAANSSNKAATNSNANTSSSSSGALSSEDRAFITDVAADGMEEVELGRLAAQKGQSPDVKKFGQKMVDDHTKAGEEVKQLATRKGITLPTEMRPEQKADKDKLSKLTGAAFDKEYISMMAEDHDKDVKDFQTEASASGDADVKAFASKTLPTLQEHQKMLKDIKSKQ